MNADPAGFAFAICGSGRGTGQIVLASCPGLRGTLPLAAHHDHHLQRDVATISRCGAQVLVSLLDSLELARLRLQALPAQLAARGVRWQHLPLDPRHTPNTNFEYAWRHVAADLAAIVRDGGRVAIHCLDGRSRSGMVAALVLVEMGCAPQDAINRVRAVRPGALDLGPQEAYVRAQRPGARSANILQLDLLEAVGAAPQQIRGPISQQAASHARRIAL